MPFPSIAFPDECAMLPLLRKTRWGRKGSEVFRKSRGQGRKCDGSCNGSCFPIGRLTFVCISREVQRGINNQIALRGDEGRSCVAKGGEDHLSVGEINCAGSRTGGNNRGEYRRRDGGKRDEIGGDVVRTHKVYNTKRTRRRLRMSRAAAAASTRPSEQQQHLVVCLAVSR